MLFYKQQEWEINFLNSDNGSPKLMEWDYWSSWSKQSTTNKHKEFIASTPTRKEILKCCFRKKKKDFKQ